MSDTVSVRAFTTVPLPTVPGATKDPSQSDSTHFPWGLLPLIMGEMVSKWLKQPEQPAQAIKAKLHSWPWGAAKWLWASRGQLRLHIASSWKFNKSEFFSTIFAINRKVGLVFFALF